MLQQRITAIMRLIRRNVLVWTLGSLGFVVLYYLGSLFSLVVRFGHWPNYISVFDWWFNAKRIWLSTPSWRDSLAIVGDEWLLEIGYMNYDFGRGISEWSLYLMPIKMLGVLTLGVLLTTNILILRQRRTCSALRAHSSSLATGAGAGLVSLASLSLSWVVCCSTPTWVVGLAMMGLGVSTSLWLEPLGAWLNLLGFGLLVGASLLAVEETTPHYAAGH